MRISLAKTNYTPITEGVHVFKITDVEENEKFQKIKITFTNKVGAKHYEWFTFAKEDGSPNDGGIRAFTYLATTACPDAVDDIDTKDLIGKYVKTTIAMDHYTDRDGNERTKSVKAEGAFWEVPSADDIAAYNDISADDLEAIFA